MQHLSPCARYHTPWSQPRCVICRWPCMIAGPGDVHFGIYCHWVYGSAAVHATCPMPLHPVEHQVQETLNLQLLGLGLVQLEKPGRTSFMAGRPSFMADFFPLPKEGLLQCFRSGDDVIGRSQTSRIVFLLLMANKQPSGSIVASRSSPSRPPCSMLFY